ncbi:hypothetical protein [Nonomuraea candida]|uniref:hypothetical protein n=1 Tax=Nonomuraea candida TaxID=359159 RepID=UPI0005BCC1C5|nr:hypothetical protein [Nonomuraea candida]
MTVKRFAAAVGAALLATSVLAVPAHARAYDYVCLLGGQTFPPVGLNYDFLGHGCRGTGSVDVTIAAPPAYHFCRTAEITNTGTRSLWATDCVQIQD